MSIEVKLGFLFSNYLWHSLYWPLKMAIKSEGHAIAWYIYSKYKIGIRLVPNLLFKL